MNTFWISVFIFCCLSKANPKNHELQSVEDNSNILRLYAELDKLNDLFIPHIRNEYYNYDPTEITLSNAVRTALKLFNSLPSSCPTYNNSNRIYTINVFGLKPFKVLCNSDIAGPGWTVIASRSNGELNFYRKWHEYKRGFGNLTDDFFIGLDKLHAITVSQPHELYIYLEDFDGNKRFARYNEFLIGAETDKYIMSKLGDYSGDIGDSLRNNVNKKFTTYDSNDGNCAMYSMGAWWYDNCGNSNLFGLYLNANHPGKLEEKGMFWRNWRLDRYSYKVMRMMVKPKCSCNN